MMGDTKTISQHWPREVYKEIVELYPKKFTNLTAATLYAVRKLIAELKEA